MRAAPLLARVITNWSTCQRVAKLSQMHGFKHAIRCARSCTTSLHQDFDQQTAQTKLCHSQDMSDSSASVPECNGGHLVAATHVRLQSPELREFMQTRTAASLCHR